ncbi:MAG TPA: hypothetical protein VKF17_16650 [Isosphaeraceae bacterium]|nr:hypothetical protein [Isosphaeraceae bacterium]
MMTVYEATGNQALDQLQDALIDRDIDDPAYGPAERWPAWTDLWCVGYGAPLCFAELIPDQVLPDPEPEDFEAWMELH